MLFLGGGDNKIESQDVLDLLRFPQIVIYFCDFFFFKYIFLFQLLEFLGSFFYVVKCQHTTRFLTTAIGL